jgi:hypothetical protein
MRSWKLWLPLLGIVSLTLLNTGCTPLASGDSAKEVTALRGDVATPFVFRAVSVQQPIKDQAGVTISDPLTQPEPQVKSEQSDVAATDQAPPVNQSADVLADVYPKTDQAPPLPSSDLASAAPPETSELPELPEPPAATAVDQEIYPDPADTKVNKPRSTTRSTGHWERRRAGLFRWQRVWVSDGPQARSSSTSNRKDGGHSSSSSAIRGSCAYGICGR